MITLKVSCAICAESLDQRDIVKGNLVCWKCGWKTFLSSVKKDMVVEEDDDLEEWMDNLFESMIPQD